MKEKLPLHIFFIYFSPYTAHVIEIDGLIYPTIEHVYQCKKFDDPKIIEEIRMAKSPLKAWEISNKYKKSRIAGYGANKLFTMKDLMWLKVEQHDEVKKALIESNGLEIVKHITTYPPGDGFWDDGKKGEGKNHMGRMWMEIREELLKKDV